MGHGKSKMSKWLSIGLVAVLVLAVGLPVYLWHQPVGEAQVAKYYTIDINPSIELAVTADGKVVKATGLNQDGTKLLAQVEAKTQLEGLAAEAAASLIAQAAVEAGYVAPGEENEIVITVTGVAEGSGGTSVIEDVYQQPGPTSNDGENANGGAGDDSDADRDGVCQAVYRTMQQARLQIRLHFMAMRQEMRQKAQELGLSVGKYALLLEAQKQGLEITAEDLKAKSARQAIVEAGGDFKAIVLAAKRDTNLGQQMKAFNQQLKNQLKNQDQAAKDQAREQVRERQEERLQSGDGSSPGQGAQVRAETRVQAEIRAGYDQPANQQPNGDQSRDRARERDRDLDQDRARDQDQARTRERIHQPEGQGQLQLKGSTSIKVKAGSD